MYLSSFLPYICDFTYEFQLIRFWAVDAGNVFHKILKKKIGIACSRFESGPVETSAEPSLKVGPGERGNAIRVFLYIEGLVTHACIRVSFLNVQLTEPLFSIK